MLVIDATALPVSAYIGPGAGFAFISSFFILIIAFFLACITVLTWPVRAVFIYAKRRKSIKNSRVRRIIVIGFDGLDPELCREFMDKGQLPNLERLGREGSFTPLATTNPSISPVAWSSFATGANPGKHNIFDFFKRDENTYLPVLSSADISPYTQTYKIGPIRIPVEKTAVRLLRKSTAMWTILGQSRIFSTVLRVPITFPPEKFYGACLSAMCTPDLIGTQGTFTLFTSTPLDEDAESQGTHVFTPVKNRCFETRIKGPAMTRNGKDFTPEILFSGRIDPESNTVHLTAGKKSFSLELNRYSPWIALTFRTGFRKKIRGIARFRLNSLSPDLAIYMTPINIDPNSPVLPISHPFYYSVCLSKLHGAFSTLGLAEDTWALNEGVIDEEAFLEQSYDIYRERKRVLMDNIRRNKEGLLVSVFDTTDRIQHMFFRYLDKDHPANEGKDVTICRHTIQDLYRNADDLVGEVLEVMDKDDLLMVISDHGFKPFKYGVNLNSFLYAHGYLVLKENEPPGQNWFGGIDWENTRAYAYGLSGVFINTRGRESKGCVDPGKEKTDLLRELKDRFESISHGDNDIRPIRRAALARNVLKGPYTNQAPDLLIGYESGYRASWNCATGRITDAVIEPNTKRWSGDHCMAPELVPGVFFSNWKLEEENPALIDLAPTILTLFGVGAKKFQDGRPLTISQPV